MAENITIKVEHLYYDTSENAEEAKPEYNLKNDDTKKNETEAEHVTTGHDSLTNINYVIVKSEVCSSPIKQEAEILTDEHDVHLMEGTANPPPNHHTTAENDFILPDIEKPQEPVVSEDGVTDEDLNRNAVVNGKHSCGDCQRTFSTKPHLRNHKILHSREKLECHICLLRFERLQEYSTHLTSHNMKYSCFACGKRFKSFANLESHKKIHSDIQFYKCERCSKEFTQKANLSRHQKLGGCKNKDDLTCPVCNKVFEREFFLKSHLKKHTSERPFQCDLCFMFFKHKSTLARHIQIHNGIRPHACKFCNKTFTHKGLLEPHLRKHTGEKPFPCPGCSKKFSHKHNMLRHFERHAKEKNLQCKLCNKIFPRESRLIYHMRSHTNSKPFKCDVCGRKFTHKSNVMRHYSRKHPNDKYEAKYTDAAVAKQVWEKVKQKLLKAEEQV